MVPRCGYYEEDGALVRKTVYIDWSKGFDKEAKHSYCYELIEKLSYIGPVAEVTSASPFYETRQLSPLFVKVKDSDKSVEDYLLDLNNSRSTNIFDIKGLPDLILLHNLSEKELRVVNKFKVFADVFANPNKGFGNSQACSYAIYKVLEKLGKLKLLESGPEFMDWYNNEMQIVLLQ